MISKRDLNLIMKAQNKCISLINGQKTNEQVMYKELQLIRFEDMIRIGLIKLGYKITRKILPNPLILAFEQDGGRKTHPYNTRNKSLPNIQKHTKNLYNTSFMCKALAEYAKVQMALKQKKWCIVSGRRHGNLLLQGIRVESNYKALQRSAFIENSLALQVI